ncbi:hypothetical protein FACS1894110_14080 [Spirochaetia bacterium]|nr:hypothetical protein FACS1894110_14080 [Spirochaetia bacterium]
MITTIQKLAEEASSSVCGLVNSKESVLKSNFFANKNGKIGKWQLVSQFHIDHPELEDIEYHLHDVIYVGKKKTMEDAIVEWIKFTNTRETIFKIDGSEVLRKKSSNPPKFVVKKDKEGGLCFPHLPKKYNNFAYAVIGKHRENIKK